MKINTVFIVSLAFLITACEIETAVIEEEPKSGPDGSWWAGGVDGGVYLNIYDDDNHSDDIYQGVIYSDSTERIRYKGRFKYIGDGEFSPEDKTQYDGWGGDLLLLKNGAYLRAIDPFPVIEQPSELDLIDKD